MRLHHVLLANPKCSPEKLRLSLIEIEQLPDIENIDTRKEISCLKRTV